MIALIYHSQEGEWKFELKFKSFIEINKNKDNDNFNKIDLILENENSCEILKLLINGLDCIINQKMHHKIILYINSLYLYNLLNEWLDKWKIKNFYIKRDISRPNRDLLLKLYEYKHLLSNKLIIEWIPEKLIRECQKELILIKNDS